MFIGAPEILLILLTLVIFIVLIWLLFFRGRQQQQQQQQVVIQGEAQGKKRVCPKCGWQNDKESRFCSDCGFKYAQ